MPYEIFKRLPDEVSIASGQEVMEADRRRARRHQFCAEAEVTDLRSGVKLSARVSDLSLTGCYLDTLNPYPVETAVGVRLFKGKDVFEARARVSYCQPGLGMGLVFIGVAAGHQSKLEEWLSDHGAEADPQLPGETQAGTPEPVSEPDQALMIELVRLLNRKGILTDQESAALLRVPRS